MSVARWDRRFFTSTRGRIVLLLRRAAATVDELASALGLTDNAVRSHLTALERDGLVEQTSLRPSGAKPANVYSLTADAEGLFPKAYATVLDELLEVLQEQLAPDDARDVLLATGRRLAKVYARPRDGDRAATAAAVLEELGGLVEVQREGNEVIVRGSACPLAQVVPGHRGACDIAAELLTSVLGVPVQEQCDTEPPPHCRFVFEN